MTQKTHILQIPVNYEANLKEIMFAVEHKLVREALEESAYSITRAAELLRISRTTLSMKMLRLGLRDTVSEHQRLKYVPGSRPAPLVDQP